MSLCDLQPHPPRTSTTNHIEIIPLPPLKYLCGISGCQVWMEIAPGVSSESSQSSSLRVIPGANHVVVHVLRGRTCYITSRYSSKSAGSSLSTESVRTFHALVSRNIHAKSGNSVGRSLYTCASIRKRFKGWSDIKPCLLSKNCAKKTQKTFFFIRVWWKNFQEADIENEYSLTRNNMQQSR